MTAGTKSEDNVPHLYDATDDVLDASETVVPILPEKTRSAWLEHRGQTIELRPGTLLIGRSAACQLVLEDSLVSRRHALLVVKASGVKIKDLESANGVYVNSAKIDGAVLLNAGDRIVIGQEEMVFREANSGAKPQAKYLAETLHGVAEPGAPRRSVDQESEMTQHGQALVLLGGVADKVLALGRGEEAERILSSCLLQLLARSKEAGQVDEAVAERAATYAVRLAIAAGKTRWIDYAFELYTVVRKPLPSQLVDDLYKALRSLSAINLAVLRAYVAVLRAHVGRFGPTERFLAHRIEGMERLLK